MDEQDIFDKSRAGIPRTIFITGGLENPPSVIFDQD